MFDLTDCQLNTAIVWPYLFIIFSPLFAPTAQKGAYMNKRANVIQSMEKGANQTFNSYMEEI